MLVTNLIKCMAARCERMHTSHQYFELELFALLDFAHDGAQKSIISASARYDQYCFLFHTTAESESISSFLISRRARLPINLPVCAGGRPIPGRLKVRSSAFIFSPFT